MTDKKFSFSASVIRFVIESLKTIRFWLHYLRRRVKYGKFEYPYIPNVDNNSILVLATGPSLKKEIEDLRESGLIYKSPLFVMNFFANSDLFVELKPSRYCLADPTFYDKHYMAKETMNLVEVLNKTVNWSMTMYVPNVSTKEAKAMITNKNIKIVPISTLHFEGYETLRNKYYKKGFATPSFVNVLMMIEYVCLNEGFKNIYLYGVDHTFLKGIVVEEDNNMYVEDSHFYGTEKKYANIHEDGTPWGVAEFIYDKYLTFVEHGRLRNYADYIGATIINCTKGSWIDSYVRLSQIKDIKS